MRQLIERACFCVNLVNMGWFLPPRLLELKLEESRTLVGVLEFYSSVLKNQDCKSEILLFCGLVTKLALHFDMIHTLKLTQGSSDNEARGQPRWISVSDPELQVWIVQVNLLKIDHHQTRYIDVFRKRWRFCNLLPAVAKMLLCSVVFTSSKSLLPQFVPADAVFSMRAMSFLLSHRWTASDWLRFEINPVSSAVQMW